MPLLSHVDRIAATRSTYVYAFRRLVKLHNVPIGQAQDFFGLPETLHALPEFRADLFRVAASALANSPDVSVSDVLVMVALAMGGEELAAAHELDVPEELLRVFTDGVARATEAAPGAAASAPQPAERTLATRGLVEPRDRPDPPLPTRAAEPLPDRRPSAGVEVARAWDGGGAPLDRMQAQANRSAAPPRRPPILQQALLADLPEDAPAVAPASAVANDMQRLEAERIALERRLRKMERRLHLVASQLESMQSPPAAPATVSARPGSSTTRFADDRRGFERASQRPVAATTAFAAPATPVEQPLRHRTAEEEEAHPDRSPAASVFAELLRPLRSRTGIAVLCGLAVLVVAIVLLTHSTDRRQPQPNNGTGAMPAQNSTSTSSADDWVASDGSEAAGPRAQAEADITKTLAAWAEAAANNDPVAESSFYAPIVDRYFLQRNVSRDFVLRDKQAYRSRGNRIERFAVSRLNFQFQYPSAAMVTFTKSWSVSGPSQTGYLHTTRSRVWLARLAEGWRITGEQDLRPSG